MLVQIVRSLTYDALYRQGQAVLDKYNPCNLQVENGVTVCNAMRYDKRTEPCCGGCSNLRDGHGCTVSSLSCKLWLCGWAIRQYPQAMRELLAINHQADAAGIHYAFRGSKAEHLREQQVFEEGLMPFEV